MQSTSSTYQTLLRDHKSRREVKVVIEGDTYDETKLSDLRINGAIFQSDTPSVGGVIAKEINLTIRNPGTIPRMAEMRPYVRLNNGTVTSEWLPKGVFYINTRSRGETQVSIDIQGYDGILKTAQVFTVSGDQGLWPMDDIDVVREIATRIGVSIDARTVSIMNKGYQIPYPGYGDTAYTMREVLGFIGSMYAGNWIMNETGQLRLVVLGDLPDDSHYLVDEIGNAILVGGVRILV